jgi:hypothetical protein
MPHCGGVVGGRRERERERESDEGTRQAAAAQYEKDDTPKVRPPLKPAPLLRQAPPPQVPY